MGLLWLNQVGRAGAPFPGRRALPAMKGTKERVGILVPQQEGHAFQLDGALPEVVPRQFAPGVFHQLLKGDGGIRKPALQGARAHAQFLRDMLKRWTFPGQGALEGVLHLFPDAQAGIPGLEFAFQ